MSVTNKTAVYCLEVKNDTQRTSVSPPRDFPPFRGSFAILIGLLFRLVFARPSSFLVGLASSLTVCSSASGRVASAREAGLRVPDRRGGARGGSAHVEVCEHQRGG